MASLNLIPRQTSKYVYGNKYSTRTKYSFVQEMTIITLVDLDRSVKWDNNPYRLGKG